MEISETVAGGGHGAGSFRMSREPLDLEALRGQCLAVRAGAFASFEGWVRNVNEGQAVSSLEYDAYCELAEKEGAVIVSEACARWPLIAVVAAHRVGHLGLGDCAVYVGVASQHRAAAFEAVRYLIDQIKDRVPIWKKEHYQSGSSQWIHCHKVVSGDGSGDGCGVWGGPA